MNRIIQILFVLLLVCSVASAQIIADFEKDANGFADNGWGKGFTSVGRAADPTGASSGVLKLSFDGTKDGKGDIQLDNVDAKKAQVLTYWIWLPTGTPDSIVIKLWAQDNKNWAWTEKAYRTKNIPKQVWYPLSFYLDQYRIDTVKYKFDAYNNKIGKMGIEVAIWDEKDADRNWAGSIYVDNVSLVGVEPKVFADFETGTSGFADNGWGKGFTSVTKVADPTSRSAGVLALAYNGTDKGVIQIDNQDAKTANMVAYWIWLPTNTPDSLSFKLWAQDNKDWGWTEIVFHTYDMVKGKWFPLYYDAEAIRATPGSKFDHHANKIAKMGIEIAAWDIKGSDKNWSGTFYVDNASYVSTATGAKWVVADFEAAAGGTYGFVAETWGPAFTQPTNIVEPNSSPANRVLSVAASFNATNNKGVISKGGIKLAASDSPTDTTYASAITFGMFVPSGFPASANPQIGIVYNGSATTTWLEDKFYFTGKDSLVVGKWNTLKFDAVAHKKNGEITDIKKLATVYVQFYFGTAATWTGNVYFDNLTLVGVPQPTGSIASPQTTGKPDTTLVRATNKIVDFVRLDWIDNTLGSETYNLYVSDKPITDSKAAGVVKFAPGIPHGLQRYAHRPYTSDGATNQLYYAVTATDGVTETAVTDQSKVGPISIKTTKTFKVQYVKDFATKFQLDGMDNEFTTYKVNQITPETAGGPRGPAWTPSSSDLNFKVTLVIDDKYLYVSADITDDNVNTDPTPQAWQGDAIEFFMGFYDTRPLKELHAKNYQNANGDWRIAFTSRGTTAMEGGGDAAIPGCKATVFQKLTGDGYIAEARITLDSLSKGKKFALNNAMLMPFRIDCNDTDPIKKDSSNRGLQLGVGGVPTGGRIDGDEDWKRPHAWGLLEVVGAPVVAVEETDPGIPKEFKLHSNYPNPFNPSTTIRYDLKEDVHVVLKVFDILGREVRALVNADQKAGYYSVQLNASQLSSGVYFYSIEAGTFNQTHKMMLVK